MAELTQWVALFEISWRIVKRLGRGLWGKGLPTFLQDTVLTMEIALPTPKPSRHREAQRA